MATMLMQPVILSFATGASVSLSLSYGPPTSSVRVSGKGFKGGESITLSFDTTQVGTATGSNTGSFSSTIIVPAAALPGNHFVQAKGTSSGFFAQATFLVQTDWVQFGFNRARTHFNGLENVLNPTNVRNLTRDWTYTTDSFSYSSPAVANGIVYIGSYGGKVYAVNDATGAFLWSYTTGNIIFSSPAVANGIVYISSEDENLYALNAFTGKLLWSYNAGSYADSPLTASGMVYVSTSLGKLDALNALTGQLIWSFSASSSPVISNGILYVLNGKKLYALHPATGKIIWYSRINLYNYYGSITVDNGIVYTKAGSGLYALNTTTGQLVWSYPISFYASSPAVANGVVYVGSADSNVYALDATTGAVLWSYTTGRYIESSPTVANGILYIASYDSNLYAFHLPGTIP
jgi:outer membrane protein assembly factor BamB